MTIEKRGSNYRIKEMVDGKYLSVIVDHKPTKKEAEALISKKRDKVTGVTDTDATFRRAFEAYIEAKSNVLSPSTIRSYKGIIKGFSDEFIDKKLVDINQYAVQAFINDYSKDHAPKTVRNAHGLISAVFAVFAPSLELHTTLPQKSNEEPYSPTEDDVRRILEIAQGTKYELPFLLGIHGLRRSEVCALTKDDLEGNILTINKAYIQTDDGSFIIRHLNKNDSSTRNILVSDEVVKLINATEGRLFEGHPNRIRENLMYMERKLGIPEFPFHKLRHFFASYAHSIGMTEADIMYTGGWSTPYVMKGVYRHAMDITKSQKSYADRINGLSRLK